MPIAGNTKLRTFSTASPLSSVFVVYTLLICVICLVYGWHNYRGVYRNHSSLLSESVGLYAQNLEAELSHYQKTLRLLSEQARILELNVLPEQAVELTDKVFRADSGLDGFALFDGDGRMLAGSRLSADGDRGVQIDQQSRFAGLWNEFEPGQDFGVGRPVMNPQTGDQVIPVLQAVRDSAGALELLLAATVSGSSLHVDRNFSVMAVRPDGFSVHWAPIPDTSEFNGISDSGA